MDISKLSAKQCKPCTSHTVKLDDEQARLYLNCLSNWEIKQGRLRKEIKLADFQQALALANEIGPIAEAQNHHPDLNIGWGFLQITIYTHAIKGLSENDFILAAKIDRLMAKETNNQP